MSHIVNETFAMPNAKGLNCVTLNFLKYVGLRQKRSEKQTLLEAYCMFFFTLCGSKYLTLTKQHRFMGRTVMAENDCSERFQV
jgi:hypothetical protein